MVANIKIFRGEIKMKIKKLEKGYYRYGEYDIIQYKAVPLHCGEVFGFGLRENDKLSGFGHSVKNCQSQINKLEEK